MRQQAILRIASFAAAGVDLQAKVRDNTIVRISRFTDQPPSTNFAAR